MNIYKLVYTDKSTALADLLAKNVYVESEEGLVFGEGVHAIVEIGKIVSQDATFDEQGNMLTDFIFVEGYHYDVMAEQEIDFPNAINPENPKHNFA